VRITAEINAFLRELKVSWQEESNFQEMTFWVRYVNGIIMSE